MNDPNGVLARLDTALAAYDAASV
jgi:hypothetical protein